MENNSDRMGFALIALSVVAFVLLAVNGPLKSTVGGFFNGFKDWQTQTFNDISESNKEDVIHTAYSWSSDGTDRFTTTKPNLNLIRESRSLASARIDYDTPDNAKFLSIVPGENGISELHILQSNVGNLGYYFRPSTAISPDDQSLLSDYDEVTVSIEARGSGNLKFGIEKNGSTGSTSGSDEWRKVSLTSDWTKYYVTASIGDKSTFLSKGTIMFYDYNGQSTIDVRNIKFEKGSVATPWMPSASEVKPSDQPKYIGTYTDKNESSSQDPSKYTWKLNPEYHE